MIHWLIKPLVPEVTFHAWVKPVKSIKVSAASCMDHQGPEEITKATGPGLLLCSIHILQIYESESMLALQGRGETQQSRSNLEPNIE